MAVKSIKPSFIPSIKTNSLSYSNELFNLCQSSKKSGFKNSGGHWSPRLHISPVKICPSNGEIDEFSDYDEFELTRSKDIKDYNLNSDRSSFEYFNNNNKFFNFKAKFNHKDSEHISMNDTVDETVNEDTADIIQIELNNQTVKNISFGLSKFNKSIKSKQTKIKQLKSWIKKDTQEYIYLPDKRVQFTLVNSKGEQKIVDIFDDSDTESESEDSLSFYGI